MAFISQRRVKYCTFLVISCALILNVACSESSHQNVASDSEYTPQENLKKNHFFEKSRTYSTPNKLAFAYSLSVPLDFADRDSIPLIVYLHGNGGDENSELVTFSAYVQDLLSDCAVRQPLIIFPSNKNGFFLLEDGYHLAHGLIEELAKRYSIVDVSQRLLVGFSTGGAAASRTAIIYPTRFSTSVSWAGGLWPNDDILFESVKKHSTRLKNNGFRPNYYVGGKDDPHLYKPLWKQLDAEQIPYNKVVLEGQRHHLGEYLGRTKQRFKQILCGLK